MILYFLLAGIDDLELSHQCFVHDKTCVVYLGSLVIWSVKYFPLYMLSRGRNSQWKEKLAIARK